MFRALSLGVLCTLFIITPDASGQNDAKFVEPSGTLTLQAALGAALLGNPALSAFSWELRAADARIVQAGLRPNPELSIEIEEVRWTSGPRQRVRTLSFDGALERGTLSIPTGQPDTTIDIPSISPGATAGWEVEREQGAHSGFSESEITLSISQLIELGRKRAKRVAVATREKELVQWDYQVARADVLSNTALAFIDLLIAQENLALQNELLDLAEDVARSIGLRVQAGQVSPLENNRAEVALVATRVERDRAQREIEIARARLAENWGSTSPSFTSAVGRLDDIADVPTIETLVDGIRDNPDLARWTTELAAREAALTLERAKRIPDPTLELGFRSAGLEDRSVTRFGADTGGGFGLARSNVGFDRSRDNSIVLGLSVPLPIFDRNQGNIAAAGHIVSKASDERRATEVAVRSGLFVARESAAIAHEEIEAFRGEVLLMATETFEKTQQGYEQGKFNYLDVLDSQRTLFDLRTAFLDALRRFHVANIEIERLTGKELLQWNEDSLPEEDRASQ